MIHRFVDMTGGRDFPFALTVSFDGVPFAEWTEGWQVPSPGTGPAEKISGTVHVQDGLLGFNFRVSPDGSKFAFIGGASFDDLMVASADGSGETAIKTSGTNDDPMWIDNDWILYRQGLTDLRRIRADGTGDAAVKSAAVAILGAPSNDGSLIAYMSKAVSGGDLTLGVVEPDGTNDTTLVADCGAFPTTSVFYPMWRHDDSKIVFYNGDPTPDEWQSIEPDGTNQATEFTSFPASQLWTPHGMHTDRFFFTNPLFSPTNEWRLYEAVFGGSVAAVSPTRFLSRAVQRGFPMVHEGRVYCIQEGNNSANGLESVFSILPDGSDYTIHYDPDESGTPWFETPTFA